MSDRTAGNSMDEDHNEEDNVSLGSPKANVASDPHIETMNLPHRSARLKKYLLLYARKITLWK